jgi:hypothetical protein
VPLTTLGTCSVSALAIRPASLLSHSSPATMLTSSFPCMILHRRNLACIGCGCPRSGGGTASSQVQQQQSYPTTRMISSPRFTSVLPQNSVPLVSTQPSPCNYSQSQHSSLPPPAQKSAHPLLTPSGRAFAVGGKVQNISSDPLSPCIMYWPDNEPFPEQGQIRPSGLVGIPVSL